MKNSNKINRDYPVFSANESRRHFQLYRNMVLSTAFENLRYTQKLLLICIFSEYLGPSLTAKNRDKRSIVKKLVFGDEACIVFSREEYKDKYNLYSNATLFKKDVEVLIHHGFIVKIAEKHHSKNVFRFSENWKKHNPEDPFPTKPVSIRRISPTRSKPGPPAKWQTAKFPSAKYHPQFAIIYHSLLISPKFKALAKKARLLYIFMLFQRNLDKKYIINEGFYEKNLFIFNKNIYENTFELYKNHDGDFIKDRKILENNGFIKLVSSGKNTRQPNIYKFISDWH